MSDLTRAEVIKHLEFLKLAGQIDAKPEKINPDYLQFAINSLKIDEAYNLMYEKVDFIVIPEKATNGDIIKAMFNVEIKHIFEDLNIIVVILDGRTKIYDLDWWNALYKAESEK